MINIKVLGTGCENCNRLESLAKDALKRLMNEQPGTTGVVEKVTDPLLFADYGLLATPGLVINEELISAGQIPTLSQLMSWYYSALAAE